MQRSGPLSVQPPSRQPPQHRGQARAGVGVRGLLDRLGLRGVRVDHLGERLQPEFVVSTVLAFAQQQLAKWCLTINPLFPLIALRAHFDDSPAVAEIQRIIPWFSERSLYYPEERNSVAKELRALGREDIVLRLVNLLRGGVRRHRLRIVESVDEIFPEDIFRFKTYRSTIGSVNNLQMSAALVGSAPLDGGLVHEIAAAINKRRTEPSPSGALLPQALEEQIVEANRCAAKHLGFRSQ